MDSSQSPFHYLQFHQEDNSPYLYQLAQDELLWFERENILYMDFGKQIDTININKSNYTCYEDNSNSFMPCMEKYYSKKLGCVLPWALNINIKEDNAEDILNLCKGQKKFQEFKNIAMNILKPNTRNELIKEGCFIPNCMQRSWEIKKEKNREETNENGSLITGFQYKIHENTKVLVRKEVRLYTVINFFAEVGGYLGLLLGESLLSYLITVSKWLQIIGKKLRERCRKADEGPESSNL